jgi:hypothetical protein
MYQRRILLYVLYMVLLISKLFQREGLMGGVGGTSGGVGGVEVRNVTLRTYSTPTLLRNNTLGWEGKKRGGGAGGGD